jgi:hypothetical protein
MGMLSDLTPLGGTEGSVAPGDTVTCSGGIATVRTVTIVPPGPADHGCIRHDFYALKIETNKGVRWVGGTSARIGSDLRVWWSR